MNNLYRPSLPVDTVMLHARARRARSLAVGDFLSALPARLAALGARFRSSHGTAQATRSHLPA